MLDIVINGLKWEVKLVSWNNPSLYRDDNTLTVGMCDSNRQIIYISNYITDQFLLKVIIHEITHAFVFSYGLHKLKLDCEERIADMLASYGAEILALSQKIWEALKRASQF